MRTTTKAPSAPSAFKSPANASPSSAYLIAPLTRTVKVRTALRAALGFTPWALQNASNNAASTSACEECVRGGAAVMQTLRAVTGKALSATLRR